jgi:GNAT superfamily N-acetyltransferase
MRIRRLDDADAVAAGSLLARAFVDSPTFAAAVPDRAARRRLCGPLFIFNIRHACQFGEAWAIQDPDGILLAVAYTVDRPEPPLTPEAANDLGFTALGSDWAPELARLGAFEAAAAGQFASLAEPWRYLGAIGVEPRLQGRGHGSALLAYIIERAGALPIGLVTDHSENIPFYKRAGLSVTWAGAPLGGGPSYWCMTTAPADSRSTQHRTRAGATPARSGQPPR